MRLFNFAFSIRSKLLVSFSEKYSLILLIIEKLFADTLLVEFKNAALWNWLFWKIRNKAKLSKKINRKKIFGKFNYLKKHSLQSIKSAQKQATKNIFKTKKIPFRSFEIFKKNEKTLGEIFTFFMLETILLGRLIKLNPFDQPAVELIKDETKKLLA